MAYSRIRFEIQNSATMTLVQLHVGRPFNPRHRSEVEDFEITLCVSFLKQRYRTAAPKWLS